MPNANELFKHTFPGTGYPFFTVEWPDFDWPTGNPTGWTRPVVDGYNHGIGSRTYGQGSTNQRAWRAMSTFYPGRLNYKCDLDFRFKNPESGVSDVSIIVRMIDYDNCLLARLKVGGPGGTPTLKIIKVSGGIETQLGATYSGFSNSNLFSGMKFRFRVEDKADGSGTRLTCYKDSTISDNGTIVLDVTDVNLAQFGGNYTAGIEIRNCFNDTIYITSLTVYDFADEWVLTEGVIGDGWQVELGDTLYSIPDLAGLVPAVKLQQVKQAYGSTGNEAMILVYGDFKMGGVVYPGQTCRVFHDTKCRFAGQICEADQSAAPQMEQQSFRARDAQWLSRQVILQEDDNTGTLYFNVFAPGAADDGACTTPGQDVPDEYRADRQNMSIGAIIKFLFTNYTDGIEKLRFYGAAPTSGNAYVQGELDLLDAVIPDLHVSGTFLTAVQQLLKYMPKFQPWVDPETKIWHFIDILSASAVGVMLPNDVVPTLHIKPDPDKSYTAIVWRGAKPQDKDPVTLTIANGGLVPAWTKAQEDNHDGTKTHLGSVNLVIATAGTDHNITLNGKFLLEVDFLSISIADAAKFNIQTDDWRGALVDVNGYLRFVVSNTATRFWLSPPNWASPPAPGSQITVTYLDKCAQIALSQAGVGRGFYLHRPGVICGIPDLGGFMKAGLKNKGGCGSVTALGTGLDGVQYAQQYEFQVAQQVGEMQAALGVCDPTLLVAKKVLKPMALINFFEPKSSAPKSSCQTGQSIMDGIDLSVQVSENTTLAAIQRYPTKGYHGKAFAENSAVWDGAGEPSPGDWRNRNVLIVDDPEFRDLDIQGPGILKAQQAIIALFGEKAYTVECVIVTPWHGDNSGVQAFTTRFAFGPTQKTLQLSSTKRATGFEAANNLPIYEVVWDIERNTTTVNAGTPVAWSPIDAKSLASTFVDKNILKKVYNKMKEVEDYRNQMLAHSAARLGDASPFIDGCQVKVSETDTKKFTDIQDVVPKKDRKIAALKNLDNIDRSLLVGVEMDHPGAQVSVPGLSTADAQVPKRSAAVLESLADSKFFDQGPGSASLQGDRSRYGGLVGQDNRETGSPATTLVKIGGLAFRSKPDDGGNDYGNPGQIQYSVLDAHGSPGGWVDYNGPTSLPNGHTPTKAITDGSLLDTILSRVNEVESSLGRVIDATSEKSIQPGKKDIAATVYPDGAPADLLTVAMAMTQFQGSKVLPETLKDPGGVVFTGSKTEFGVDSGTFWRVEMPERIVAQVTKVGWGAGTNGGAWSLALVNGQPTYANSMTIVHKQADGPMLDADQNAALGACSTQAVDDSPFLFNNARGKVLDPALSSGAGTIFMLPKGAHGTPAVEVIATERLSDGGSAIGLIHALFVAYSYKQSPWTGPATTGQQPVVSTDGAGTGTGQFKAPMGAVPPGLRVPSDIPGAIGVSVRRNPGGGIDTAAGRATVVIGIGIDLAVVDGGTWIRIKGGGGCKAVDSLVHNHPAKKEGVHEVDVLSLEFGKTIMAPVVVSDNVELELNPPVALNEAPRVRDVVVLQLNP